MCLCYGGKRLGGEERQKRGPAGPLRGPRRAAGLTAPAVTLGVRVEVCACGTEQGEPRPIKTRKERKSEEGGGVASMSKVFSRRIFDCVLRGPSR